MKKAGEELIRLRILKDAEFDAPCLGAEKTSRKRGCHVILYGLQLRYKDNR